MPIMKKTGWWIFPLALLGLALTAAVFFGWPKPVVRALRAVMSGAVAPVHAIAAKFAAAVEQVDEERQKDELRRELEILQAQNARLAVVTGENEDLRAALKFAERVSDRLVPARIISESGDDSVRAWRLDRGSDDGLAPGQAVIVGDGLLIGRIYSVRAGSALVLMLNDSRSRVAVSVNDSRETIGVLEGDRGLSMTVSLIPQTAVIAPGDAVITSGLEPGVRRGLAIGTIEKIEKSERASFQSAVIRPFSAGRFPSIVQVIVPTADFRLMTDL